MPEIYINIPNMVRFMNYQSEKINILRTYVDELFEKKIKVWNLTAKSTILRLLLYVSSKNSLKDLDDEETYVLYTFAENITIAANELITNINDKLSIAINRINNIEMNESGFILSDSLPVSAYEYIKEYCEFIMVIFGKIVNTYQIEKLDEYLKESLRALAIDIETYNNFINK